MSKAHQSGWVLVLIGLGKLLKASALLTVSIVARRLIHQDLAVTFARWVHAVRIDPDNVHVHAFLARAIHISPHKLAALSVGTFLYAALYATEGVGLVLRKRWAEFLTVISTALLLPLEIFELFYGHHKIGKLIVLLLNILILIYLIYQLRKELREWDREHGNQQA